MSYGIGCIYDPIRETAFGAITGSFVLVGTVFGYNIRQLTIINGTNETMDFSISSNGVNAMLSLPPSSGWVSDITANETDDQGYFITKNTGVWVRHNGVAPTSGSVSVTVMHSNE